MKNIARVLFFALVFVFFFNGYVSEGPSRKKFKRLGEGSEDLTKEEVVVQEVDPVKALMKDKKLKEWAMWWQKCVPGFSIEAMESMGREPVGEMAADPLTDAQIGDGPGKMFYQKSPDGKRYINPWLGRLLFKKEGDAWQPYVELPCGVALYEPKAKKARMVLECSTLAGIDDGYWSGNDRIVLMGYEATTRQMNVECESAGSCISPAIWIADLKTNQMNQHRGPTVKRTACKVGDYLKIRLPNFFGEKVKQK